MAGTTLDKTSGSTEHGKSELKHELADVYNAHGLPATEHEEPVEKDIWAIWKKYPNESWLTYSKRLCIEGHSVPDAFLTVAASQIGQIMLTCPNALWRAGLVSGCIYAGITIVFSLVTMFFMNVLYIEYKRPRVKDGSWFAKDRHATQYHDVVGYHAGKVIAYAAQTFVVLQLLGTGIAQVIACATDWYAINQSYSKQDLQLIWGGILQVFAFFPTFKHFRILNVAALVGTTFTAIWILAECAMNGYDFANVRLWPTTVPGNTVTTAPQFFFTGAAVLMNALGGHSIAFEMMDAMETPKQYTAAYWGGWLWTIFLVMPHSIAVNLSFPTKIGGADNVYQVLPMSKSKVASVALMIIHQLAAFAYYVTPVFYLWERFIHTHNKPWYIRLPSRLPVSLFIWLIAMLFPFYGAINSLMSSISTPFTAFVLPCGLYYWIHRKKEQRDAAILRPFKFLEWRNWIVLFVMCITAVIIYTGFGVTAIAYSIKSIVDNSKRYGVLAQCYQCPPNWQELATKS